MATYFMSTTGSDGNSGTILSPWATFNRAFNQSLTPHVVAGDTLYLRNGNYGSQGINNASHTIPTGTSWSNAPIIASYTAETATIRTATFYAAYCKYVIMDRIIIDGNWNGGVITGNGANHIRWTDCQVTRGNDAGGVHLTGGNGGFNEFIGGSVYNNGVRADYDHGLYIHSPNNLVDGVDIYDNAASGVHLYISSLPVGTNSNNIVRNCIIRNNRRIVGAQTSSAAVVGGGTNILFYNNIIYNTNGGNGIQVSYGGVSNAKIVNNTIWNCTGPQGIDIGTGALNITVKNNILYQSGVFRDNGSGTIKSNNLIEIDPKFINAAGGNFRLQSTSPCIDAGVVIN